MCLIVTCITLATASRHKAKSLSSSRSTQTRNFQVRSGAVLPSNRISLSRRCAMRRRGRPCNSTDNKDSSGELDLCHKFQLVLSFTYNTHRQQCADADRPHQHHSSSNVPSSSTTGDVRYSQELKIPTCSSTLNGQHAPRQAGWASFCLQMKHTQLYNSAVTPLSHTLLDSVFFGLQ